MSTLQKIKDKKAKEALDLEQKMSSLSLQPNAMTTEQDFLSEIEEEIETHDIDDDFDKEISGDYDDSFDLTEEMAGEEKASKNYMMDNSISTETNVVLSSYFKKLMTLFLIPDMDNQYNVQQSIRSYLKASKNKSLNDESVITAIVVLYEYTKFIKEKLGAITNKKFIEYLIEQKYLKFASLSSSSFLDVKLITKENKNSNELYFTLFNNANKFIHNFETMNIQSENNSKKNENLVQIIATPMNPDLIFLKEFDNNLFTELKNNIKDIYDDKYVKLLSYFTSIINSSGKSTEIVWNKRIVPINVRPDITNTPIIIRNLISMKLKKYNNFTKEDLAEVLLMQPELVINIRNFCRFLKMYQEKKKLIAKKDIIELRNNKRNNMDVDIDVKEKEKIQKYGNLFIKKRK
jgi:hypothetical protein